MMLTSCTAHDAPVVRCSGLSKSFGMGMARTQVLNDLELSASPGELTFIVGPSGCGKTTLLSIIAGFLEPDNGTVELFSTPLSTLTASERCELRSKNIGFVLQQFNLLPALDLVENVAVPLLILGKPSKLARRKALAILERFGMAEHLKKHPRELSVGQQQRVAIARALVHEPNLIICDEPTAALDAQSGLEIVRIMRDMALTEQRSVIIVTHDNRITRFADRVLKVEDGRIRLDQDFKPSLVVN